MREKTRKLSGPSTGTAGRFFERNRGSVLRRYLGGCVFALLLGLFALSGSHSRNAIAAVPVPATAAPNIAFFYGHDLPIEQLQAFDVVVIDPTQAEMPAANLAPHTSWFAHLQVGGLATSAAADPAGFVSQAVDPLWNKGYRGFLLDDGADLSDNAAPQSDAWLGAAVRAIHAKYPQAQVMLRNHLALAAQMPGDLYALAVDALYQKYDTHTTALDAVTDGVRADALQRIRALAPLPVVAIDYCARTDLACRRDTAHRLVLAGVTPFVTDPTLTTVGVGRIESMPRKVLMVQTPTEGEPIDLTTGARDIATPLNYMGYDVDYVDVNKKLPEGIYNDQYAGIVVSIDSTVNNGGVWRRWLLARIREGMRVAVIDQFGFDIDQATAKALDLDIVPGDAPVNAVPQIVSKSPMMGFEIMPPPDIRDALGIRVGASSKSLLRMKVGDYTYDMAGMTPWGGFTLSPYGVASLVAIGQERWAIQPIDFLKQALALPDMPVPDVTSENGRRLMFVHVDGDGFASRTEFPGPDYDGEALYDEIFSKFPIPQTLSVIEGEVGPQGMYPKLSPRLEEIARKMFALPNVEIGTHTYSHPFNMEQINGVTGKRIEGKVNPDWGGDDAFSLDIPNYKFDLNREIQGSIDYINKRLAPPGKHVVVLQWPGDAQAPAIALRMANAAGVLSINGGDTTITKTNNSWTNIAPYGVAKGKNANEYQVYAAVMDENVYTNDWTGPFYGFSRVLETFAMTDQPIRFKALNIYYHFYSGSKLASLQALKGVYESVLKQNVFPIYTTEYIRRVLDWRRVSVAREVTPGGTRWLVRSGADLRELRWPANQGVPDLSTSSGVTGYLPGPGGLYVHMANDQASFSITSQPSAKVPYIAEAAGFVRHFQRDGRSMQFDFGGYYKPFVRFADAGSCRVQVDGKAKTGAAQAGTLRIDVAGEAAQQVTYHSIKVDCE
jgi:hypothetical protein